MIEPTNRCTLRCPTCFSHQDGRNKRDMGIKEFKRIIDANANLIKTLSLYNYGEPFVNNNLMEMVFYAKNKGIHYVKVATNGMHLTKPKIKKILNSGLDYLSISLDGAIKETYDKFRIGGRFQRVVSNIHNLARAKKAAGSNLSIEVQFIIMRHNEHEIADIANLAMNLGVDFLRLKTVLIKKHKWKYLLPVYPQHSRYIQKRGSNKCLKPLKELVINSDGTVIPCCYIVGKDIKKFKIGNIFNVSLQEILNTNKYREFIKKCTIEKSSLSCCVNCNEGSRDLNHRLIKLFI